MSLYVPAESSARIQVAIAETVQRQVERKTIRAEMSAARRVGLARRHNKKLASKGRQAVARVRGAEPEPSEESGAAKHFRLADTGLQTATLHLGKLRSIPAARDALKLVRQAQNLLMDAEEDAA